MRLLTSIIVLGLVAVSFGADVPPLKNADARTAMTKYQLAVKAADDVATKAKQTAAKELVVTLEKAKKDTMASGNLEAANEIQAVIDSVGKESAATTPSAEGRYFYAFTKSSEREIRIDADGKISQGAGPWEKSARLAKDGITVTGDAGSLTFRQSSPGIYTATWPKNRVKAILIKVADEPRR